MSVAAVQAETPAALQRWMAPQRWVKDTTEPVLPLGPAGAFDDTHLLGPCVALEGGAYFLWYSGSRGEVKERVYHLGLATSADGWRFARPRGAGAEIR